MEVAKLPDRGPRRRKAADKPDFTVIVDGDPYPVRLGEITGNDSAALRRQSGISMRQVLTMTPQTADLDLIAAMVWLSRRQRGEASLQYDEVAEDLGYNTPFNVVSDTEDSDPDSDPNS